MFVSMQTIRRGGSGSLEANAEDIASSNGNAMVTPDPRKMVRRGKAMDFRKLGIEHLDPIGTAIAF